MASRTDASSIRPVWCARIVSRSVHCAAAKKHAGRSRGHYSFSRTSTRCGELSLMAVAFVLYFPQKNNAPAAERRRGAPPAAGRITRTHHSSGVTKILADLAGFTSFADRDWGRYPRTSTSCRAPSPTDERPSPAGTAGRLRLNMRAPNPRFRPENTVARVAASKPRPCDSRWLGYRRFNAPRIGSLSSANGRDRTAVHGKEKADSARECCWVPGARINLCSGFPFRLQSAPCVSAPPRNS